MFAPESCRNESIRFFQRCWCVTVILSLITALIAYNVETFAEEANSKSDLSALQTQTSVKDSAADSSSKKTEAYSTETDRKDAEAVKSSDKKAPSADDDGDEDKSLDSAEMLDLIRKSYAKKNGADNSKDNLIVSQSSACIFLNRKKIRDVSDNILDHWYLSSFEDDFNLTRIEFDAVVVNPLVIDLDIDIESRLSLKDNDSPIINNTEALQKFNAFINFPIPESVMNYIKENSEDIVDKKPSRLVPETLSSYNYVVLFLAILGLSILGYVIYKLVVWAFLLDQNPDYDLQKGNDEDVVAPVNMDAFSAYIFQEPAEKK